MKLQDLYRAERREDGWVVVLVERTCNSEGDITSVNRTVVSRHALEESARDEAEHANKV